MKHFSLILALFVTTALSSQTPYGIYPLDGNANETSGHGLNGTIGGSPTATTNRANASGKAMQFNGTTDYITLGSDFDFPNHSISLWFYATAADSIGRCLYHCDHASLQYGRSKITLLSNSISGTVLQFNIDQLLGEAPVILNQWNNVVLVRSTTDARFYINGAKVYTGASPSGAHTGPGGSVAVVGASKAFTQRFAGKIDDVLIYGSALTDNQVLGLYTGVEELDEIDATLKVMTQNGFVSFAVDHDLLQSVESASLYDISGRLINTIAAENNQPVNSSALSPGIYFVRLQLKETSRGVSRKVVIN